jgi:transposase InsO family protein
MIESTELPTIVFTDHASTVGISKQTSLSSVSTDKLNLRLVRASEYLQRFRLDVRHRSGKSNAVPDALSRLATTLGSPRDTTDPGTLDSLYAYTHHASLVEMSPTLRSRLIHGYTEDTNWSKIQTMLKQNEARGTNAAKLPFIMKDQLIYHLDQTDGTERLCIPDALTGDIFRIAHDELGHPGYHRTHERIAGHIHIHQMAKKLKKFITDCPQCQLYTTPRHRPYGNLQPILTPATPFHTITLDFVVGLPLSVDRMDSVLTVTDKFSKRVTFIPGRTTWSAGEWALRLLERLAIADWGLPKIIISDRDSKFLSDMWRTIFSKAGTELLYSTSYHPQTDGQSERTNQTAEISLRYYIATLSNENLWPTVLPRMQSAINNAVNLTATGKSPNEILYGFKPKEAIDLLTEPVLKNIDKDRTAARIDAKDAIAFAAMRAKSHYDRRHHEMFLNPGNWVNIRLHRGYTLPGLKRPKTSQQFVGPFRILERVGRLAYRLDLPTAWRIHPVLSIAHLEPVPNPASDPYGRARPDHPPAVQVESGEDGHFEIDRIIRKRDSKRGGKTKTEYLIRWKGYGPEDDSWFSKKDLANASDLVRDYEDASNGRTQ